MTEVSVQVTGRVANSEKDVWICCVETLYAARRNRLDNNVAMCRA